MSERISSQPVMLRANRAYTAMVDEIVRNIAESHLSVGDRLPSEAQLSKQYGISVTTLRKGIDLLVEQGIIERRHGSGMFVKGVPASRPCPVRRDTIAVIYESDIAGYHPYFSEMRKAVATGLTNLGWKLWQQEQHIGQGDHFVHRSPSPDQLRAFFREHREIGGAVLGLGVANQMKSWPVQEQVPFVVPGAVGPEYMARGFAFASYRHEDEKESALRLLLRQGARRILLVSREHPGDFERIWDIAVHAETSGRAQDSAPIWFHANTTPSGREFSCWVSSAYELTLDALSKHPEIDGILAASDFEAQGALDALSRLDIAVPNPMRFVALINKESQLRTRYLFSAIVMDGQQHGLALAHLLNDRILMPETAPMGVWLRGSQREYVSAEALAAQGSRT